MPTRKNYFDFMKNEDYISPEGYIQALRAMANWANGNLMGITRVRIANFRKTGNHDDSGTRQVPEEMKPGMPSESMSPTKRGSLFASIREHCFEEAQRMNLKGFDVPRDFSAYLDGRAEGFRRAVPTKDDINTMMTTIIGITKDQAYQLVMKSNAEQAAQIEKDKADLIAEDSSYDSSIDIEEVQGAMPILTLHRMRVKLFDSIMYECERLLENIAKFPRFLELITKRELLIRDAIQIKEELDAFEEEHDDDFARELNGTTNVKQEPLRRHLNTLHLVKLQLKERQAA